jgi:hypothetical protein
MQRACGYGELLAVLGELFSNAGMIPWADIAKELDMDLVRFYRDVFKVCSCPASLRQEQLNAFGAILASNDTNVGQVLHE